MQTFRAELHLHTVLSPCAEVEMIPPLIVQEALEQGIQLIAVTDHNASANVEAVQKAAAGSGLIVLPGMELQTVEEIHLLCLFDTQPQLAEWQSQVNRCLPPMENNIEFFGEQFVVDETGDFIRRETQLLITSAHLGLSSAVERVRGLGGLAIPAHVDRRAFGLIANLGFVPTDVEIEALEVSRHIHPAEACRIFPQITGYPLIQSGDVHRLNEFLGINEFFIESPCINELRLALRCEAGRSCRILSDLTYPS